MSPPIGDIRLIQVPRSVLGDSRDLLRRSGVEGLEAIVLWAGDFADDPSTFWVRAVVLPAQQGGSTDDGLLACVDGDEIFRVNKLLSDNSLRLVAQLHTHPTSAYHSETDDTYPLLSARGSVSIVVPDFARDEIDLNTCAVYRLTSRNQWQALSQTEILSLIRITDG